MAGGASLFHREIRTEIEIDASASRVWAILTDFDRYPEWNPFVRRIEGVGEVGKRFRATIVPPGSRGMSFSPTLLKLEPKRELRWIGHLLVAGVFDGEHIFEIEPIGERRVRFVQRERFRGLFTAPLLKSIGAATRQGFEAMNRALKAEAEKPLVH